MPNSSGNVLEDAYVLANQVRTHWKNEDQQGLVLLKTSVKPRRQPEEIATNTISIHTCRKTTYVNKTAYQYSYPCEFCEKSYTSNTSLKVHMKAAHESSTFFKCEICKKTLSANKLTNIKKHFVNVHNMTETFPSPELFEVPRNCMLMYDDNEKGLTLDEWIESLEKEKENEEEEEEGEEEELFDVEENENIVELTEEEKCALFLKKKKDQLERQKIVKEKYDSLYSYEHVKMNKTLFE